MRSSVRRETRHLVTAHPPLRTGSSTPTLVGPATPVPRKLPLSELVSVLHLVPAPSVREKEGTSFIRPNIPRVDQYTAVSGNKQPTDKIYTSLKRIYCRQQTSDSVSIWQPRGRWKLIYGPWVLVWAANIGPWDPEIGHSLTWWLTWTYEQRPGRERQSKPKNKWSVA